MPYTPYRGLGQDGSTTDSGVDDLSQDLQNFDAALQNTFGPNASLSFLEPLNTGDISSAGGFGPVGSPVGCAAGYVVGDASGNCVSSSSTQGQAAAASFSSNPAAQIAASLQSLFAPNSPLSKAILPNQNAGTVTINSNSLLLYGGIAVSVIVLLSLMRHK